MNKCVNLLMMDQILDVLAFCRVQRLFIIWPPAQLDAEKLDSGTEGTAVWLSSWTHKSTAVQTVAASASLGLRASDRCPHIHKTPARSWPSGRLCPVIPHCIINIYWILFCRLMFHPAQSCIGFGSGSLKRKPELNPSRRLSDTFVRDLAEQVQPKWTKSGPQLHSKIKIPSTLPNKSLKYFY